MKNSYVYAVRNIKTGKLMSNLTSKSRKYWARKYDAITQINYYNTRKYNIENNDKVELVIYKLQEVKTDIE